MNLYSKPEILRCRPLLGTFVEIKASGLDGGPELESAVKASFALIETIQRRMSVHDPESELSFLNQEAFARPVRISDVLFQILTRSIRLSEESEGAFDCTIAPVLAEWGFLPARLCRRDHGNWRDVSFLPGKRICFLKPLAIDLGGIAKGFSVDEAINTLRERGVVSAVVNAGGDMRVFGPDPVRVHLRHPRRPRIFLDAVTVKEGALATSASYFNERFRYFRRVSHLVHPGRGKASSGKTSVTVRAAECWLADALTKVVLNAPRLAERLLAKHHSDAFVLTA